jgi:hypothetical protein
MPPSARKKKKRLRVHLKKLARERTKQARLVADRLLGKSKTFMPGTQEWKDLNWKKLL